MHWIFRNFWKPYLIDQFKFWNFDPKFVLNDTKNPLVQSFMEIDLCNRSSGTFWTYFEILF